MQGHREQVHTCSRKTADDAILAAVPLASTAASSLTCLATSSLVDRMSSTAVCLAARSLAASCCLATCVAATCAFSACTLAARAAVPVALFTVAPDA